MGYTGFYGKHVCHDIKRKGKNLVSPQMDGINLWQWFYSYVIYFNLFIYLFVCLFLFVFVFVFVFVFLLTFLKLFNTKVVRILPKGFEAVFTTNSYSTILSAEVLPVKHS
jgi:hypothetical protein